MCRLEKELQGSRDDSTRCAERYSRLEGEQKPRHMPLKMSEQAREINSLKEQLDRFQLMKDQSITTLQSQLSTKDQLIRELKAKNRDLNTDIKAANDTASLEYEKKQTGDLAKSLDDAISLLKSERKETEELGKSLDNAKSLLKKGEEDARELADSLYISHNEVKKEQEKQAKMAIGHQAAMQQLHNELQATIDKLKLDVDNSRNQVQDLGSKNEQLKIERDAAKDQVKKLKEKTSTDVEMEDVLDKHTICEAKLRNKDNEIHQLKHAQGDFKREILDSRERLKAESEKLRSAISNFNDITKERDSLRQQARPEIAYAQVQHEIENQKDEVRRLKKKLQDATMAKDRASNMNIEYRTEIGSLKAARTKDQEHFQTKEQEIQSLRHEITIHLAEVSKLKRHSDKRSRSVDEDSPSDTEGPKNSHKRELPATTTTATPAATPATPLATPDTAPTTFTPPTSGLARLTKAPWDPK